MLRVPIILVAISVAAFAADPPVDAVQIGYASGLFQGDAYINLTNGGANGAFLGIGGNTGDVCANVYVFSASQVMLACCSCLTTPDGLYSFSAKNDLLDKVLVGTMPNSVVIKITATTVPASGCNAALALTASGPGSLTAGLRAWGTTLHVNTTTSLNVLTENAFQQVTAGVAELTALPVWCGEVLAEGSRNYGFCNSCPSAGLAGAKQ
jgi:hypothetical protein